MEFSLKRGKDIYTENIYYSSWRNSDVRCVLVVDGLIWAQKKTPIKGQDYMLQFVAHSLLRIGVKPKHLYKYFSGWEEYKD